MFFGKSYILPILLEAESAVAVIYNRPYVSGSETCDSAVDINGNVSTYIVKPSLLTRQSLVVCRRVDNHLVSSRYRRFALCLDGVLYRLYRA